MVVAGTSADGAPVFQRLTSTGDTTGTYFTLDSAGNQVTVTRSDNNVVTWFDPPNANQVLVNKAVHDEAVNTASSSFKGQGLQVDANVSISTPGAPGDAVPDLVVTGQANQVVTLPPGMVDEATGATTIQLNANGRAVIDVKTGCGSCSSNQNAVYPAVQTGTATAVGPNASKLFKVDPGGVIPPTPVFIIRKR